MQSSDDQSSQPGLALDATQFWLQQEKPDQISPPVQSSRGGTSRPVISAGDRRRLGRPEKSNAKSKPTTALASRWTLSRPVSPGLPHRIARIFLSRLRCFHKALLRKRNIRGARCRRTHDENERERERTPRNDRSSPLGAQPGSRVAGSRAPDCAVRPLCSCLTRQRRARTARAASSQSNRQSQASKQAASQPTTLGPRSVTASITTSTGTASRSTQTTSRNSTSTNRSSTSSSARPPPPPPPGTGAEQEPTRDAP